MTTPEETLEPNSLAESSAEPAYPRPQFRRTREPWLSLDGPWRFAFDEAAAWRAPSDVARWTHTIRVPFAPEAKASGIGDTGFHRCVWYERDVELPRGAGAWILHFGAVDYIAKVWVNGRFVACHEGGHTPFSVDISDSLAASGKQVITVRVEDDPLDLAKPRGKQDWQLEPHSIWYPRTTGIWQSVWLERVPETYLDRVRWTPHLERWAIECEAFLAGRRTDGLRLQIKLSVGDQVLADDSYQVILGEVHRSIALSDPGIDDFRNELLWSPEKPTLIKAEAVLWRGAEIVDAVSSYTALRSVAIHRDRFMLNGRPYYLRLVLDQGYWPETLMTAPDDEALREDIRLTKAMGFNGVRKHQKIEDPRYLYWADRMGLLVWEEMPSAYRFTHESVERITREWTEVIDRDYNHPCIVCWVPFNESWGVPDLADKASHRSCVQALYHLTKTLDTTRPVIGNDGWESTATDILGIHDYDGTPQRIVDRYSPKASVEEIFGNKRPAGRVLTVDGYPHRGQPVMLTEFGGIGMADRRSDAGDKQWGYVVSATASELERKYTRLLKAVNSIELFSGFCYTQLADTFQEANGLLYADRSPKIPLEVIRAATRGDHYEQREVPSYGQKDFPAEGVSCTEAVSKSPMAEI